MEIRGRKLQSMSSLEKIYYRKLFEDQINTYQNVSILLSQSYYKEEVKFEYLPSI